MKYNKLSLESTTCGDIQIAKGSRIVHIPRQLVLTDAFMRGVLSPKEKMIEATDLCYLSLLSWRMTNVLLKDTFDTLTTHRSKAIYSVLFSSVAGERIMTFDPSFVTNAILEKDEAPEDMIYTVTLRDYIEDDLLTLHSNFLTPLRTFDKRKLFRFLFQKYQNITKSCVDKIQQVTYNPRKL